MKKLLRRTALLAAILLVSISLLSATVMAKSKTIMLANFEPEQAPWSQAMKAWGTELEKVTNGQVKARYSFGGAMVKPGEGYDLVTKGILDAAPAVLAFGGPGLFPMIDTVALQWNIPTATIGGRAMMAFKKKGYLDKELEKVQVITLMTGQGDTLFTKKKAVTTLADVKGLKLFATTPVIQARVKAWGGIPVALPMTDLYSALQKGVIDGIILNYNVHAMFKLAELLRHATLPGIGSVCSAFIMNKRTFNKLPPEGQKFVQENGDKYADIFNGGWDGLCGFGKDLFLKNGGKEHNWTPEAMAERAKFEGPAWEAWIADKEKRGLPGRKAVNDFYKIMEDLGIENPAIGYTPK